MFSILNKYYILVFFIFIYSITFSQSQSLFSQLEMKISSGGFITNQNNIDLISEKKSRTYNVELTMARSFDKNSIAIGLGFGRISANYSIPWAQWPNGDIEGYKSEYISNLPSLILNYKYLIGETVSFGFTYVLNRSIAMSKLTILDQNQMVKNTYNYTINQKWLNKLLTNVEIKVFETKHSKILASSGGFIFLNEIELSYPIRTKLRYGFDLGLIIVIKK